MVRIDLSDEGLEEILNSDNPLTIKKKLLEAAGMDVPESYRETSQNLEGIAKAHAASQTQESTDIVPVKKVYTPTSNFGKYAKAIALTIGSYGLDGLCTIGEFASKAIVNIVCHTVILPLLPNAALKNYKSVWYKGGFRAFNNIMSIAYDVGIAGSIAYYATENFAASFSAVMIVGYVSAVPRMMYYLDEKVEGCFGPVIVEAPYYIGKKIVQAANVFTRDVKYRVEALGNKQATTGVRVEPLSKQEPNYIEEQSPEKKPLTRVAK